MDSEGRTKANPNDASTKASPATVAVIGGGPGAMFICHSLETQKKELESRGEDTSAFPIVKVFERAVGAGGVWRSDRSHDDCENTMSSSDAEEKKDDFDGTKKAKVRKIDKTSTNMYSALWTNGAKESFEFYDYTFPDHFGNVRMPTYLPRKHVLDYLLGRVTKNCPDFFERYFHFRTTVQNVRYLEDKCKFRVSTFNDITQEERVEFFDKCVWAAGENGIPSIPKPTVELLENGGFPGRMVHSSDTSTFKEDVEGKNVLMIGGSLSAEDLALMAIKEGANKIYIASREDDPYVDATTRWPYDKVETLCGVAIESVEGREITLGRVYFRVKKQNYIFYDEDDYDDDYQRVVLSDIDTVIFCTGYKRNLSMLDPALSTALPGNNYLSVSKDWTPKPDKLSQKVLGDDFLDMRPKKYRVRTDYRCCYGLSDDMYKSCFCIDNPNMMYLLVYTDTPLMGTEINAWMIAKVLSDQIHLPSPEEMRKDTLKIVGEFLQCNFLRRWMDYQYQEAMDDAMEDYDSDDEIWDGWENPEYCVYRVHGQIMLQFEYPLSYISAKDGEFTDYFKSHFNIEEDVDEFRENLEKCAYGTNNEKDGWRTFRDISESDVPTSFLTGIKAVPLPKPWEEIHEDDVIW